MSATFNNNFKDVLSKYRNVISNNITSRRIRHRFSYHKSSHMKAETFDEKHWVEMTVHARVECCRKLKKNQNNEKVFVQELKESIMYHWVNTHELTSVFVLGKWYVFKWAFLNSGRGCQSKEVLNSRSITTHVELEVKLSKLAEDVNRKKNVGVHDASSHIFWYSSSTHFRVWITIIQLCFNKV